MATSVSVVDNSIERLICPLPEGHSIGTPAVATGALVNVILDNMALYI